MMEALSPILAVAVFVGGRGNEDVCALRFVAKSQTQLRRRPAMPGVVRWTSVYKATDVESASTAVARLGGIDVRFAYFDVQRLAAGS